jgi:hypothetical protein
LELCRAGHPGLQTQMACQGEEQEREREKLVDRLESYLYIELYDSCIDRKFC